MVVVVVMVVAQELMLELAIKKPKLKRTVTCVLIACEEVMTEGVGVDKCTAAASCAAATAAATASCAAATAAALSLFAA